MQFINANLVKGTKRSFSASISCLSEDNVSFVPLDLNPYSIRFRVLGAPTADAKVLLEKMITQNSDPDTVGYIDTPHIGFFVFVITVEDTIKLGLGQHPIMLEILDGETDEPIYTLTEGGYKGEFNKLYITEV